MLNSSLFVNFLSLSQYMTFIALGILFVMFYIIKMLEKKKIDFSIRMLSGVGFGVLLGVILQFIAQFPTPETIKQTTWIQETIVWYGLFGRAFLSFLKMMVIPIILISLIRVILNLEAGLNIKVLIKKTLFWLLLTTGIAAFVGMWLAIFAKLGSTLEVGDMSKKARDVQNIVEVLIGLIPANPVNAMAKDNVVGIVIFASMIGSAARFMRTKEKYQQNITLFANIIEALYNIVMSMAMTIIKFMPYAVVALMARTLISYGLTALNDALTFIILVVIASVIMLIVYTIIIAAHGLNPLVFFKKAMPALLMAFSSRSSIGTLPVTITTLEEKLGVNNGTANFVGSLGSTAGMNACSGYFPAMSAVLIATAIGIPVDLNFMIMVVVVALFGSLGIAGIPGAATMAVSIMISGIGLSEYFGLLAIVLAIDPIIDMARTMVNVAGTMTTAVSVDKELGSLNETMYNDMSLQSSTQE